MSKPVLINNIRDLRFEQGRMSQQALADAVGCTRQTIIMLEQGRYSPSLTLAFAIASVFNRSIEEIFQVKNSL